MLSCCKHLRPLPPPVVVSCRAALTSPVPQAIRCSSRDYLAKRRAVAERLAPRLCRHGYTALMERLLRTATEGHAWQADHIVPVYAGGGMCDIDNMRTLCVACHAGEGAKGGSGRHVPLRSAPAMVPEMPVLSWTRTVPLNGVTAVWATVYQCCHFCWLCMPVPTRVCARPQT